MQVRCACGAVVEVTPYHSGWTEELGISFAANCAELKQALVPNCNRLSQTIAAELDRRKD
jgi:hypothetical protein